MCEKMRKTPVHKPKNPFDCIFYSVSVAHVFFFLNPSALDIIIFLKIQENEKLKFTENESTFFQNAYCDVLISCNFTKLLSSSKANYLDLANVSFD